MSMPRFLALVGDMATVASGVERRLLPCGDLTQIYAVEGMRIFLSAGGDHVTLPPDTGLIVGQLFDRSERPRRIRDLSAAGSSIIDNLLRRHWGGYVAILCHADGQSVCVLRDPSSTMPCFYIEHRWGVAVASDADILVEAGLLHPEINWGYIAKYVQAPGLTSRQTGLAGLMELPAGTSLTYALGVTTVRQHWSPWDHVDPISELSPDLLAERLRATIQGCVTAWAGCFGHILLGVSGGLDSSVVASALAERGNVTCYTIAAADAEGDERHYARMLTDALKLPLLEGFYDIEEVDIFKSNGAHLPFPIGVAAAQSNLRVERQMCEAHGIDMCFGGAGGDAIFCYTQSAAPLIDVITQHGFGREALRTLGDICDLTDSSYGAVVKAGLKKAFFGSARPQWHRETLFLGGRIVASDPDQYCLHSWLDVPRRALPGKAAHVKNLLGNQMFPDFTPYHAHPRHLFPLMAQPIVELCLGIPTWLWVLGGQNRAMVRRAFARLLPPEIINRRTKGGPNAFLYELVEKHRDVITCTLSEGTLARHELIDVGAIRQCLQKDRKLRQQEHMRLLELMEVEAWVHAWSNRDSPRPSSYPIRSSVSQAALGA